MKKKLSILAVLLLAVVTTAYSVSGTYAKYTSTFETSSTARVAKWAIKFGADETTSSTTFTFNLFDTIKDTDGNDEADVKDGGTLENIIAPGTQGSFNIQLYNASEVNAEYTLDLTLTNNDNIPVEFSKDGTKWETDITKLNITNDDPAEISMGKESEVVTIQWRWPYSDSAVTGKDDEKDTDLGEAGLATLQVDAKITATQVD